MFRRAYDPVQRLHNDTDDNNNSIRAQKTALGPAVCRSGMPRSLLLIFIAPALVLFVNVSDIVCALVEFRGHRDTPLYANLRQCGLAVVRTMHNGSSCRFLGVAIDEQEVARRCELRKRS